MLHKNRVYCVGPAASAEELAEKLTNHTWTLCTGFELGDYLFLNDSFGEDVAQEYAVLKKPSTPSGSWRQVESITMSWCSAEKALDYIRRTLAGEYDEEGRLLDGLTLEPPEAHDNCPLCA